MEIVNRGYWYSTLKGTFSLFQVLLIYPYANVKDILTSENNFLLKDIFIDITHVLGYGMQTVKQLYSLPNKLVDLCMVFLCGAADNRINPLRESHRLVLP